jgi:hypothetical protein
MVKVVSPISNREVEIVNVDFEAKAEPWATYELSDGTTLKLRTTIVSVSRLEGEHDAAGNPSYNVASNTTIRVVSAPKELRGAPTGTGSQTGKTTTSGPEVR